MTTKDQRIDRLRDALAHIANASSDDEYNAAPAWAAAALAEDDQLALAIASPKPLADVACYDAGHRRRRDPRTTLYPGDVVRRKGWADLPGTVIGARYDPGLTPVVTADHGLANRRKVYAISEVVEVISRGEIGRLHDQLYGWFKPEHQQLQAAGPLLQACAHRGMTAAQALDRLAKLHEQLFAHTISLAHLGPPPVIIAADGPDANGDQSTDEVLACWKDWFANAPAGKTSHDPDTHED